MVFGLFGEKVFSDEVTDFAFGEGVAFFCCCFFEWKELSALVS